MCQSLDWKLHSETFRMIILNHMNNLTTMSFLLSPSFNLTWFVTYLLLSSNRLHIFPLILQSRPPCHRSVPLLLLPFTRSVQLSISSLLCLQIISRQLTKSDSFVCINCICVCLLGLFWKTELYTDLFRKKIHGDKKILFFPRHTTGWGARN